MKRILLAATLFAATVLPASAVDLTLLKTVDLNSLTNNSASAQYIGNNISALAWDGSTAYVGGTNASGATGNVGIVKITNTLAETPTFSDRFGTLSVANGQRISHLVGSTDGTQVFASLETGASNANGVRAFDSTTFAQQWAVATRGSALGLNVGFAGASSTTNNPTSMQVGSGNLNNYVRTTGALSGATGGLITPTGGTTQFRAVAYDPANGDVYARESNRLVFGRRTGTNNYADINYYGGLTLGAGIDFQSLAVANTPQGKFVFLNNRPANATGIAFSSAIQAYSVALNGAAAPTITADAINFSFGSAGTPANGIGAYDFDYAPINNTLAVTDYFNRQLYIFNVTAPVVIPEAGTVSLFALGTTLVGGIIARRKRAA